MTIDGGRVVVRLEGKDINLSQLITKVEQEMNSARGAVKSFDSSLAQLSPTLKRVESQNLAYASALAKFEAAAGRSGNAIKILSSAIAQSTPNTTAAATALANLQNQLNRYGAEAEAARQKTLNFATNAASSFNQLIGASFALQAVGQSFAALINAGNQLEKTQATFRALSVTQEEYTKNLAIAKEQQALFGGSLEENMQNLSGFIFTARTAGVDLDELANIARRLAIIDPVQG